MNVKILVIGDIVGRPGRNILKKNLHSLRNKYNVDFVIANCENAAGGSGITLDVCKELFDSGIDVLTSGDHIWSKRESLIPVLNDNKVLRPANYPSACPGKGFNVFRNKFFNVGVVNLLGRVFLDAIDCPFKTAESVISEISRITNVIVVDMHGEATSEKIAMGWFLDGKVSFVFGTHTHVQTADEVILPNGTAYLTDVGMTGPFKSVIGREIKDVLEFFTTRIPRKLEVATDDVRINAALVEVDSTTGKAFSIKRIVEY